MGDGEIAAGVPEVQQEDPERETSASSVNTGKGQGSTNSAFLAGEELKPVEEECHWGRGSR